MLFHFSIMILKALFYKAIRFILLLNSFNIEYIIHNFSNFKMAWAIVCTNFDYYLLLFILGFHLLRALKVFFRMLIVFRIFIQKDWSWGHYLLKWNFLAFSFHK